MSTVRRLIGVYDADGSLRGELAYWVGARLGRSHCALCDITHGRVRERADWRARRDGLPVPFTTLHRDEVPGDVAAVVGDRLPAVVAETDAGVLPLLDSADLDACAGDPSRLVEAVEAAVAAKGLAWR